MKVSHVHCHVRDLAAAAQWFERVWQVVPVVHNERMAWLGFGEFGVILDAAPTDSVVTLGFDSEDCDADYRTVMGPRRGDYRGAARSAVGRTRRPP